MRWHRLVLPERQYSQVPHSGVYSGMTWSPTASVVTPSPTSSTMPPPSWPRIVGNSPSGSAPERVKASVWQTPVATMRTSTSPAFGPATSTCSIDSGLPASQATAARDFMGLLVWRQTPIMPRAGDGRNLRAPWRPVARAASGAGGFVLAQLRHLHAVGLRFGQQPFAEH